MDTRMANIIWYARRDARLAGTQRPRAQCLLSALRECADRVERTEDPHDAFISLLSIARISDELRILRLQA